MDEQFGNVSTQMRILGLGEEKHFGVDAQPAERRVTVAASVRRVPNPLAVMRYRGPADVRFQTRSAKPSVGLKQ